MPSTSGLMRILLRGLFIPASLILVVQATAVRKLWITERDIPIPGLSQVPTTLGAWKSQGEMALDPASAEVLKPDDYIMRDYTAGNTHWREHRREPGREHRSLCSPLQIAARFLWTSFPSHLPAGRGLADCVLES